MELIDEKWKIIDEFPQYAISNKGRVKSLYYKNNISKKLYPRERLKSLRCHRDGYLVVKLSNQNKGGVAKNRFVHRLVAKAFILNPHNKTEVNHKNGIKTDNRMENLEWCTRSENMKHAYDTGLHKGKGGNYGSY